MKIGKKYIVPKGTKLFFVNLQQEFITCKKYVIEVTNTLSHTNTTFFGKLHEVVFETQIPGLLELKWGEVICSSDKLKPLGNLLEPKVITYTYEKTK